MNEAGLGDFDDHPLKILGHAALQYQSIEDFQNKYIKLNESIANFVPRLHEKDFDVVKAFDEILKNIIGDESIGEIKTGMEDKV